MVKVLGVKLAWTSLGGDRARLEAIGEGFISFLIWCLSRLVVVNERKLIRHRSVS